MIRSLSSYSRVTCSSIHAVESGLMKVHLSKALEDSRLLSWICLQRPDVVLSTSVAEMVPLYATPVSFFRICREPHQN